jgi:two-component system response regulator FlrC
MSVLVFAGDADLEAQLLESLCRGGWECEPACPSEIGMRSSEAGVDALVLDSCAFDPAALAQVARDVPVIALMPDGAPTSLVESLRSGACVLLRKPFHPAALARALALVSHAGTLRRDPPVAVDGSMRAAIARVEEIARNPVTTVLSGEAGTGKTHLARWLHACGDRAQGPLIEVDCAALDRSMRLDAREPGAPGILASATGGTIVFEDVGGLAPAQQLELLRLLVDGIGPHRRRLEVRVAATTRIGIAREITSGRLHPDLGLRLCAAEIALPALRDRPGDLALLARRFVERAARAIGERAPMLDDDAVAELARLPFPGNLHELESLMKRAALLFPGLRVDPRKLAGAAGRALAAIDPAESATLDLRTLERAAIRRALEASGGDRAVAARALGIHVRTLHNKLRARV